MFTTLLAIVGVFTIAKWLLPVLFPRIAMQVRLALFANNIASILEDQARRMNKEQADRTRG